MVVLRLIVILSLLLSTGAYSSEIQTEVKPSRGEIFISDLVSPFQTNARFIVYGGVLATSLAYFNQKNQTYRKRESFKDAQPLGDSGILGDYIGYGFLNLGYIAWATWYGHRYDDAKMKNNAELMARATLYASGTTLIFKSFIKEKRPGYPDDENSFPSGHASGAFSFASVIAARHGWVYGGAAYAMAGFIAVSRVNDDFHFLHDILAGITIGASFGWGVHYNMEKGNNSWFTLIPAPDNGVGLAMGWSF
jgi:membrane-associated phospholipid phosphatase